MKIKSLSTVILTLIGLIAMTGIGYALARLMPDLGTAPGPYLPPLSRLDLPSQAQNGITAALESYYADAARLVFTIRVDGDSANYSLEQLSFKDANGEEINSSYGAGRSDRDPSLFFVDIVPLRLLKEKQLNGRLSFTVTATGEGKTPANFHFDLDIPIHPALVFIPKQTVWANGIEILLDRLVITPAYTQAYLCYIKPTDADWGIGREATVRLNHQVANLYSYGILFDSAYGDLGKGGEADWTPPVDNGRCVKIGFPIGSEQPESVVLTIPALEQSMPEVIPANDLARAYEILKAEDIDMQWHIVDHGAYPEYKKLPRGMSEQQAFHQFVQALGYTHPGKWTFELQLTSLENAQPKFSTSSYGAPTPNPLPGEEPKAATIDARIHSFDISPDMKTIALVTSRGTVLYDLESDRHLLTLNGEENDFSAAWSPDGRKLAVGGIIMKSTDGGKPHLTVFDTAAWKVIFEPKLGSDSFASFGAIAWSPDGNLLATSDYERGLTVFDVKTGKVVSRQKDFLVAPYDISWSPDGSRLIATGDLGFGFRRWRVDTDESVRLYDPRAGSAAIQLAWSPDGTRIASAHADGMVCFWTVTTNQCDGLIYAQRNMVSGLAWSPDGGQLATSGGVIHIWDSQTGQPLNAFGLSNTSIYTELAWLKPDLLVSLEVGYANDAPTVVRFWDLKTGKILKEFEGQSGSYGQ